MDVFVDANVFIFALIDNGAEGKRAADLLDDIVKNKLNAVTSVLVIDEVMWALIRNKRRDILENAVKNIYDLPNLSIKEVAPQNALLAVHFINKYGLKPRDAMHCAFMQLNNISTIVTNDKDFDKVKEVKRVHL